MNMCCSDFCQTLFYGLGLFSGVFAMWLVQWLKERKKGEVKK